MSFGITVSKPGIDVFSAEEKDLVHINTANCPKFKANSTGTGTFTIQNSGGMQTFYAVHELGYVPSYLAYASTSTGRYRVFVSDGATQMITISDTQLKVVSEEPAFVRTVKYFILTDPIEEVETFDTKDKEIGLYMSEDEKDIMTATISNLTFGSPYGHLMIAEKITASISYNDSMGSGYITSSLATHNLNYIPAWIAIIDDPVVGKYMEPVSNTYESFYDCYIEMTASGAYLKVKNGDATIQGTRTITATIFLFSEKLN